MTLLLFCLLLGCLTGLRSLTAPAVVYWAGHLGWLNFVGTKLAFIDRPVTLVVLTLLAFIELIGAAAAYCPRYLPKVRSRSVIMRLLRFAWVLLGPFQLWRETAPKRTTPVGRTVAWKWRRRKVTRYGWS
jgi:uncharacterized membrane protein